MKDSSSTMSPASLHAGHCNDYDAESWSRIGVKLYFFKIDGRCINIECNYEYLVVSLRKFQLFPSDAWVNIIIQPHTAPQRLVPSYLGNPSRTQQATLSCVVLQESNSCSESQYQKYR